MDDQSEAHLLSQSQHPDAVKRLFEIQDAAAARGDGGMVAEVQSYLDRIGVVREPAEPEPVDVPEAVVPAEPERVVPAKPRRGRRG